MALAGNMADREHQSFVDVGKETPARQVALAGPAYDAALDAVRTVKPHLVERLMENLSIAANSERGVLVDVTGCTKVFVQAIGDRALEIYSQPSPDGSYLMDKETLATGIGANAGVCREATRLAQYLRVIVKNTDASNAGVFQLWVYGV